MNPTTRSNLSFLGLVLLLTVAFFPGLFHFLWSWPLTLFSAQTAAPSNSASYYSSTSPPKAMSWFQKTFTLPSKSRGSYLITDHVVKELPEIKTFKVGILHLFVQHTSCALSMNEK